MSTMLLKEIEIKNESTIALGFKDEFGTEQELDIVLKRDVDQITIATWLHNASHMVAEIGQ